MVKVKFFPLVFIFLLILVPKGESAEIRQDILSAEVVSPQEGETQYVMQNYTNGGNYSIKLTKSGRGVVLVEYTRKTYMDGGTYHATFEDAWVWQDDEEDWKSEKGVIWLVVAYNESQVGPHTWSTSVSWVAFFAASGSGNTTATHNFNVSLPGSCN